MAKKNELPELPKNFGSKEEKEKALATLRDNLANASTKLQKAAKARDAADELERIARECVSKALAIRVKAVKA